MECYICIETVSDNYTFKCNACKSSNCIDCHKKYLLTTTQDPHCINCRAIIPYDLFMQKFTTKWIFDKYKKHRYDVLWEREQSLIPETVQHIAVKKKEQAINAKKKVLYEQIAVLDEEIALLNFNHKHKKITFQYTYACPIDSCKGFLNKDYICEICNSEICNKCCCENLIPACDLAISYFLQKDFGSTLIMVTTLNDEFIACNHKGLAYNNTFVCCGNKINSDTGLFLIISL